MAHLARHGSPETLISHNGTQYTSSVFQKFTQAWNFEHQTSSPGDSQSNEAAEVAVKSAKRVLRKCLKKSWGSLHRTLEPQEHTYWRCQNDPSTATHGTKDLHTSPKFPTSAAALKPERQPDEKPAMEAKKLKTAEYHLHRRVLKPLDIGDQVRVQPLRPNEKAWQPAVVSEKLDARSYKVVSDNGAELRRARKHLRKATPSTWPASNGLQPPAAASSTLRHVYSSATCIFRSTKSLTKG